MPIIVNNNYFGNMPRGKREWVTLTDGQNISTHIKIMGSGENSHPFCRTNIENVLCNDSDEQDSSPDSLNKRMKRCDITSWGGFDYISNQTNSYLGGDPQRNKEALLMNCREQRVQALFHQDESCYNAKNIKGSPESRGCKSRIDHENS